MALWLKLAKLICQAKLTTKRVTGKQRTQAPLKGELFTARSLFPKISRRMDIVHRCVIKQNPVSTSSAT